MGPKKYRSETASATSHPSVPLQYTQASPFVSYFAPSTTEHLPYLHDGERSAHTVVPALQIPHEDTSAGRLTPAARVGVAVNATNRPDLNAASTSFR